MYVANEQLFLILFKTPPKSVLILYSGYFLIYSNGTLGFNNWVSFGSIVPITLMLSKDAFNSTD